MRSIVRPAALLLALAPAFLAGACASRAHDGVPAANRTSHVDSYAPNAVDYSGEVRSWVGLLEER